MKFKSIIKRSIYLGYYLKKLETKEFKVLLNQISKDYDLTKPRIILDAVLSVYKYNIGLMDYFIFKFFEKNSEEREKWVGTGYKYEFDLWASPKSSRSILENKLEFYKAYRPFIKHTYCTLGDLDLQNEKAMQVLNNKSGKIVVKNSFGQCGLGIEVLLCENYDLNSLVSYMKANNLNIAEEFIIQHDEIDQLSSSGVNTIRMITVINKDGDVDILGARIRITINNHIDNLAAGNLACSIDLDTGKINGEGIFKDIRKKSLSRHPITNKYLVGYQIPMWHEVIKYTKEIAKYHPENRSVGWDIVVTSDNIDLIEGNHNWCEILWQVPVNKGLKDILEECRYA
ncbi:MAG: sugar-transfer associated ATP-grasp domain-containing protein [Crocinitomicaceae bacterium]|nr:sugar-transfer associated ATP-grasp domain-containing protein [Crocinitomicaceae bacterium]